MHLQRGVQDLRFLCHLLQGQQIVTLRFKVAISFLNNGILLEGIDDSIIWEEDVYLWRLSLEKKKRARCYYTRNDSLAEGSRRVV